jgi:hypothetical protein
MRALVLVAVLLAPGLAAAKDVNVEFDFTPFTGDPKNDTVHVVPGTAHVFLNGVSVADETVEPHDLPVLFEAREIAPAVWVTTDSLGPLVRKGKNTIRVEFDPADAAAPYRAQLRWATVTDRAKTAREPGHATSTNRTNEGVDDEATSGRLVMEHEFDADFATDQPWHHLPPVATLGDDDRSALAALVAERAAWFEPDFAPIYKALAALPHVDLAEIRKRQCIEAAHKAGVHVTAVPGGELEYVVTGGPAIVVRGKRGALYPPDEAGFARIKNAAMQTCAATALARVYPKQLVAVRAPGGTWFGPTPCGCRRRGRVRDGGRSRRRPRRARRS